MKYFTFFLLIFSINSFAQIVYKTPSGSKYHLSNCRMVKNVSSATTVERALKSGLSPCKICKPPYNSRLGFTSPTKKAKGINSLTRCKGKTKKGLRCKRKTRIGNDYCFQHIP